MGCPLTSSGLSRIYASQEKQSRIGKIIRHNTRIAWRYAEALYAQGHISQYEAVHLPGAIGPRQKPDGDFWQELNYNSFWLCYLSGIPPEQAQIFFDKVQDSDLAVGSCSNQSWGRPWIKKADIYPAVEHVCWPSWQSASWWFNPSQQNDPDSW